MITLAADAGLWDVLIVGGGLGGLSLAVELAQPQYAHLRVLVLEKRACYRRDRTWSYWGTHRHRYTDLERRRWHRWSVRFEGHQCVQTSEIAYCTIDADVFYGAAVAQIAAATHMQLRMACTVGSVSAVGSIGGFPEVLLEDGQRESARWVMDARPAEHIAQAGHTGLTQHFVGWEIHTPRDCFDDTLVELMDFQPAPASLHFFYVLPYGPRRALVETTWISTLQPPPDYEAELRAYLKSRYGLGRSNVSTGSADNSRCSVNRRPRQARGSCALDSRRAPCGRPPALRFSRLWPTHSAWRAVSGRQMLKQRRFFPIGANR